MEILEKISEDLQKGQVDKVVELVQEAVDQGVPAETILNDGLLYGLGVIGEKFKKNEVFVPEVLIAAEAMNRGAAVLKPLLGEEGVAAKGKVVLGTVKGDLHDIGKNLVKMMMESKGLEVIDLGVNVESKVFIDTAIEEECSIIACSALLTTTMARMEEIVKELEQTENRDQIKIMVGGAPVTQRYCEKIGADYYASDATSAAEKALSVFQ